MARMVLNTNGTAEAAIAAYRILKFGAADGGWLQAAAAADLLAGVSESLAADSGERVDVCRVGIADVEYGAAVTRGQRLTADAQGRAVPAVAGNQVIGVAEVSGVLGDIGSVLIAPSVF